MAIRYRVPLVWAAVVLATLATDQLCAELRGQETVIEGQVIEAATNEPRASVEVQYREYEGDHEPVSATTSHDGRFRFELANGMGQFGLLYVHQPGYNSALWTWPGPVDSNVVLRLTKPVAIYGAIVNSSGLPVSGARLKWSMRHEGRLASGVGTASQDGTFLLHVPNRNALRIAAWADLYAPTEVAFSYDANAVEPTVLRTLESVRALAPDQRADEKYLRDWINEILSDQGQEGAYQEPPPR